MDTDYPAAHSMDTAFFAVDRDGHVAHFSTGEAGARPFDAGGIDDLEELVEQLAEFPAADRGGLRAEGPDPPRAAGSQGPSRHDVGGEPRARFVFPEFTGAYPQGNSPAVPRSRFEATAVWRSSCASHRRRSASACHDAGLCLGCAFHWERDEEEGPPVASLGLFDYGHLCENWISGPYGLEERPLHPVHIDQLPPALRRELEQVHYADFCFAKRLHIQPIEYEQCPSWQSALPDQRRQADPRECRCRGR